MSSNSFTPTPEELARFQAYLNVLHHPSQPSPGPSTLAQAQALPASQTPAGPLSTMAPPTTSFNHTYTHTPSAVVPPNSSYTLTPSAVPTSSQSSSQPGQFGGANTSQGIPGPSTFSSGPPSHNHSIQAGGALPITQLYQSSRAQSNGHPAPPTSAPPSFQPFYGTGLALPTHHANHARMASANASLPRRPALSRRRGVAARAPVLARAVSKKATIEQCLIEGAGVPTVRAVVRVFPPLHVKDQLFIAFKFVTDAVDAFLNHHSLYYELDLPLSITVVELIELIAARLKTSTNTYIFQEPHDLSTLARHEALPILSLGLQSKGTRTAEGAVRLRPNPVRMQHTLQDFALDVNNYAGSPCIQEDNRWALYFAIISPPSFHEAGRRHHCLPYRFYRRFPKDSNKRHSASDLDIEAQSSGGEEVDTDSEDTEEVAGMVVATSRQQASAGGPVVGRQSFNLRSASQFLPNEIWASPWVPPSSPSTSLTFSLDNLSSSVFEAASAGATVEKLLIEADSLQGLADGLLDAIGEAAARKDFTKILSPEREMNMNDHNGRLLSFGAGVEREVLFTAFSSFHAQFGCWFNLRFDELATLQVSRALHRAALIPETRINAVRVFGALCALMLISGQAPHPLNPLIFHYMTYDCDLRSLTPSLVKEWHPRLHDVISKWIEAGPEGDIDQFRGHFASYLDTDIGAIRNRDYGSHKAFGPEILYFSILGPAPPYHPEMKAFKEGFLLPCNNGFSFKKVPLYFEGGPEAFWSLLWTSAVTSFESIRNHLHFSRPSAAFTSRLSTAINNRDLPCSLLLWNFLQGSGIPCPPLFHSLSAGFSSLIDLTKIDTPGFRSRAFLWAATGCPTVDPAMSEIQISVVDEHDLLYADAQNRDRMQAEGKISFRTCMKSVRLPALHILSLAEATYPHTDPEQPQSFVQAFDHWMLCELLSAIGGHSML